MSPTAAEAYGESRVRNERRDKRKEQLHVALPSYFIFQPDTPIHPLLASGALKLYLLKYESLTRPVSIRFCVLEFLQFEVVRVRLKYCRVLSELLEMVLTDLWNTVMENAVIVSTACCLVVLWPNIQIQQHWED